MGKILPFPTKQGEPMLDQWANYLAAQGRAKTTIKTRLAPLRLLAARYPLETLTRQQVIDFFAACQNLKPETRKSYIVSVQQFCKWAKREGHYRKNLAKDIEHPRVPKTFSHPCPDPVFIKAMRRAPIQVQLMLCLGRYAGMRLSEITKCHTADRDGDTLHVIGKGSKHRLVPINDELAHLLDVVEHSQGKGYYFRGRFDPDTCMHPQSVEKIIIRHLGLNPHSLRHAAATAAYRETRDIQAVQRFLGHSTIATTERYLALGTAQLEAVGTATGLEVVDMAA